jgi:transcriptional regulator with XRE-family HTH domain
MPTRERPTDRARRVVDVDLARLGTELRTARIGAGLSLRSVATAVGVSATHVMRVERGLVPNVSVRLLARIGSVVGLAVRVRAYPGPDPIRDAAQARLLGRLVGRLHPRLTVRTEVPLPIATDLRAWDAAIGGFLIPTSHDAFLPVDAETVLHDVQALLRRVTLKLRDTGADAMLLVIADTRSNHRAAAAASELLAAAFPISPRRTLAALSAGRHPGGSAIVFL